MLRDARAFGIDYSQRVPLWMANRGGQIKLELNDLADLSFDIKEILRKNDERRMRIVTDTLSPLLLLNQPDTIYRFLSQLFDEIKQALHHYGNESAICRQELPWIGIPTH